MKTHTNLNFTISEVRALALMARYYLTLKDLSDNERFIGLAIMERSDKEFREMLRFKPEILEEENELK